jgi:hypothetical protein
MAIAGPIGCRRQIFLDAHVPDRRPLDMGPTAFQLFGLLNPSWLFELSVVPEPIPIQFSHDLSPDYYVFVLRIYNKYYM